MRIWRHLAERRWSGQEHNIDNKVPNRRPDSLAVHCPACPEVGFNTTPEQLASASEANAYVILDSLSLFFINPLQTPIYIVSRS